MTDQNTSENTEMLTPQQEVFCRYYTQNDELFGNATLSYAEAYGYDLDNMPHDDGKFKLKDGTIAFEHEILLMEGGKEKMKWAEQVEPSTYRRNYDYCSQAGSRLRRNEKIQARCRDLLNDFMVDKVIDARLTQIIMRGSASDAINAIKEYNKLRQRIVEKKDITSGGKPIQIVFDPIFNEKTTRQTEGDNTKPEAV